MIDPSSVIHIETHLAKVIDTKLLDLETGPFRHPL